MNSIKRIFVRIKNIFGRLGRDPGYDWTFALSFFFIGIALIGAIDGFITLNLRKEAAHDDQGGSSALTLKSEDIQEAISILEKDDAAAAAIPEAVKGDPSR